MALQSVVKRLACMAHTRCKLVDAQKVRSKGKAGRADIALAMINKLCGTDCELTAVHRSSGKEPVDAGANERVAG
jgi:transposase